MPWVEFNLRILDFVNPTTLKNLSTQCLMVYSIQNSA